MDSMQLVTPAIGLMFWTVVIFMLLLILLKKFAWKPILKAVDDRNSSINEALASAEKAKSEMEQLSADNDKILNEARNQSLSASVCILHRCLQSGQKSLCIACVVVLRGTVLY